MASPRDIQTLDRLLDAAGFATFEADFNAKVEEVLADRLGARLAALAKRLQEESQRQVDERERRHRSRLDTILAVIAAAGVSGVLSILQAGFADWGAAPAR